MKERPILFSGAMVRALLDGSKTQTRRIMKPQPKPTPADYPGPAGHWWPSNEMQSMMHIEEEMQKWSGLAGDCCPHGGAADRLWVRETWYCDHFEVQRGPYREVPEARDLLVYRADGERPYEAEQPVWRPSIHMPRWASRILLEITNVRVERLQDIGVEDIEAEGVLTSDADIMQHGCRARVLDWKRLWESTGGSWDANPWVWVVEFKRVVP
ncbi:hypothetical protein [Telluria beijingensis]|uniref:hypothetical protein n=1 Tax=Telluria beijingensis TaxID=3068633 RepID=UPI003BF54948